MRRKFVGAFTAIMFALAIACGNCKRATVTAPPTAVATTIDPWKEAVSKVEQDRGEAVGRNASVEVPGELKHYADRRRFLAVQAADSRAHVDAIPHDFASLLPMIQRHQLVEMKPLEADSILYGVGQNVGGEPFAHYDRATMLDIPLAATEGDFKNEVQRAVESVNESKARLAYLEAEWRRAPRRDRWRRATLLREVAQARKAVASITAKSRLFSAFYADPLLRKLVLAEYQQLSDFARDFEGEAYDLNDTDARVRLKTRLLSFVRPEARDVLIRIAHDYKEKFNRPLPVSSLVRPEQYQHELARSNANAARGSTPPHSTGLAFDIYYRYMSSAEQQYLMSAIARLKDEGRIEALRELRDNIHVYVFAGGQRPDDKLVARVIAGKRSSKTRKRVGAVSRR
jgi:hypothetical protein